MKLTQEADGFTFTNYTALGNETGSYTEGEHENNICRTPRTDTSTQLWFPLKLASQLQEIWKSILRLLLHMKPHEKLAFGRAYITLI